MPTLALSAAPVTEPGNGMFDTPKPTPAPRAEPNPTPKPERKPRQTPKPTRKPVKIWATAPGKVALVPARESLVVGVPEDAAVPLEIAVDSGFLAAAGFADVTLTEVADPLAGLDSGELQFAVVDTVSAAMAQGDDPSLQAVAGYANYGGPDGTYGGTVVLAAPGLVSQEPSTVAAFTSAYIRTLRGLAKADRAADEPTYTAFAPYDGGFGGRKRDNGWGQLDDYLATAVGDTFDVRAFVSEDTLNLAQVAQGRKLNPQTDLAGKPKSTRITVGLPASALAGSPLEQAQAKGYFKRAGFAAVTIEDIEEPLLGVLQGDLDIAVLDTADALDGVSQGLPLVAVAGHRNYADGEYGGDVVAVSQDLMTEEGSTITAFLTAYVRALQDLEGNDGSADFAPFTGGFDASGPDAGWTELTAFATETLGDGQVVDELVEAGPLTRAQVWWGIPGTLAPASGATAEPADSPEAGASPATDEEETA